MRTFIVACVIFFLGFITGYNHCENYYEPLFQECNERINSVCVDILKIRKNYMTENKCCGNCKHFKNEDVKGKGWCEHFEHLYYCGEPNCKTYEPLNNGWTEITPDNVSEVYNIDRNRLVVQYARDGRFPMIRMLRDFPMTLSTMAKVGGYYYYVLPELNIEEETR